MAIVYCYDAILLLNRSQRLLLSLSFPLIYFCFLPQPNLAQNPCAVFFHSDQLPFGDHWRLLLHLVPEVIHIVHQQPETIFGHKFGFIQHKSDVVRLQVLSGNYIVIRLLQHLDLVSFSPSNPL